MAKIAIDLDHALARRRAEGAPGKTNERVIAHGDGWAVADVVCTYGPPDRRFEERHSRYTIAAVVAGSFQYRCQVGQGLMSAGSIVLGNQGQCFDCGHEHGEGDRCIAFWYEPAYFERLAADAGARAGFAGFTAARLPAIQPVAALIACACGGALGQPSMPWDELAVRLAVRTMTLAAGVSERPMPPVNAEARVSGAVRRIDRHLHASLPLVTLARDTGLSPYHFLRTFERVTGLTPHQYVRRARLREAATRLVIERAKVLDIALDCGFGDVSNFNRAFRGEFGMSPLAFRRSRQAVSREGDIGTRGRVSREAKVVGPSAIEPCTRRPEPC